MEPFSFLLLAHLIGDYLFQTSWMAQYKAARWVPLLTHCFVYTAAVALFAYVTFGGLSLLGVAFVFFTHVILDRRTFVSWWVRTIMTARGPEAKWLGIMADQIFHLLALAAALYM